MNFEELIEKMAQQAREAYFDDQARLRWDELRPGVREPWRKVARRLHALKYSTVDKEAM